MFKGSTPGQDEISAIVLSLGAQCCLCVVNSWWPLDRDEPDE